MYVEERKTGKNIKYYLVHSYRDKGKVRKIRKCLGRNLAKEELEKAKNGAKLHILELLEELNTEVFLFTLTKNQIEKLNRLDKNIRVVHFDQKEWQQFTEEFTYNTNAIEGSTVQRDEVPEILDKQKASGAEELETKGVAKAVNYIKNAKEDISIELIKKLQDILHQGVPLSQLHLALNDLISWHKENKNKFKPLVLAAIMHNQFEYIHPFQDGNGRVGRFLLNFILLRNNYPPINISLEDRGEYYLALQEYQKRRNLKPTIEFLVKQYKKTLRKVTTKYHNR